MAPFAESFRFLADIHRSLFFTDPFPLTSETWDDGVMRRGNALGITCVSCCLAGLGFRSVSHSSAPITLDDTFLHKNGVVIDDERS